VAEYWRMLRMPRLAVPRVDESIGAARLTVVRLDSAAAMSPHDQDIMGLRVYHNVIAGWYGAAETVLLSGCSAPEWWCSALLGFVHHNEHRIVESEIDFDRALSLMPAGKRCLWEDISHVFNDQALTNEYRELDCAGRVHLNRRIWWLSDPFWGVAGNNRRSEHFARWVTAELLRTEMEVSRMREFRTDIMHGALNAYLRGGKLGWCGVSLDAESPVFRCEVGITLGCWSLGRLDCANGHGPIWRDHFIPRLSGVMEPYSTHVLDESFAPHAPGIDVPIPSRQRNVWQSGTGGYGEVFGPDHGAMYWIQDAQAAFLLRGSSNVLLTAFDPRAVDQSRTQLVTDGQQFQTGALQVTVLLAAGPGETIDSSTINLATADPVRLALQTSRDSGIVSLEAHGPSLLSSRHRFAVLRPAAGAGARVTLSDVVMYDATVSEAIQSQDQLLQLMLPRSTLARDERVGLYWELYGIRPGEAPEFELRVRRVEGAGIFRRLAEGVGLAARSGTVITAWNAQPVADAAIGAHSENPNWIVTEFRTLRPGLYELSLSAAIPGEPAVSVTKIIRVQ
jgi:hypothetical protein